jgi:hypothetical protein
MQFLLSLIGEEPDFDAIAPEAMQAELDKMMAFNRELEEAGAFFLAGGLQQLANARTVRFSNGEPIITDGPFAETKEQLAGFWIIDCASLDEALEWTNKVPIDDGIVEVRPFVHELDEGKPSESRLTGADILDGVKGNVPTGA